MMVVPCLYFSGASGLGRDQRMKSSLSSTCQAAHNCSGLHPPPLQLREKGTTFSNSLSWPRQYVLRLLLPMRAPSHNSQHHCIGQQQLWWTPSKMVSKYLHLSKKGKSLLPLFNIILDSLEHGSRFSPGAIRNIHSPSLWHRNQILSTFYAPGLILSTASIICR